MLFLRFFLLIITIFCQSINCANILFICEIPSPSHHIWNYALVEGLLDKGHNVTMASPDALKGRKSDKYHPIAFEGIYEYYEEHHDMFNIKDSINFSTLKSMFWFYELGNFNIHSILKTKGFQNLIAHSKDTKFDLIIIDISMAPFILPVVQKFDYPPTIGVTPFLLPPYLSEMFGNNLYSSYLPFYNSRFGGNMNFQERVLNFIYLQMESVYNHFIHYKNIVKIHKKYFGEDVDDLEKLKNHVSLLLSNTDPILNHPQPLPPNIIPVGGLHTRPGKKLPQDLEKIIAKSQKGFIIVSFGTNIQFTEFNEDIHKLFLNAFSKLSGYTIIWKFEAKTSLKIPQNVHVQDWLPINDLLAHEKAKLFISHGGALSTQEAMFHGVPVLGIPFWGDQHVNLKQMSERNLSLTLDFTSITEDKLFNSIKKLLEDPLYRNNIKKVSQQFKDMQEHPLKRAVNWVDFVIKHNGAQFLSPRSRYLNYFVAASLDVILFLILVTIILFIIFYKIFKHIIHGICKGKSQGKTKKE